MTTQPDQLDYNSLILDYLDKSSFPKTAQTFISECQTSNLVKDQPVRPLSSSNSLSNSSRNINTPNTRRVKYLNEALNNYDKGDYNKFWKNYHQICKNSNERVEFYANIYFTIFPFINKSNSKNQIFWIAQTYTLKARQ